MSLRLTLLLILVAIAAAVAPGCASILSRTHQVVQFSSDVEGTTITATEQGSGRVFGPWALPTFVTLNKGDSYRLVFEAPGGKRLEFIPPRTFDPIALINILGLLGFIADLVTGAIEKYTARGYFVNFTDSRVEPTAPARIGPELRAIGGN
ncbi:MAG: hypothetical protein AB7K09_22010 [Planctomycetota bacterium]